MARRAADVVYYVYDSKNNPDCMYNTLMNVTGCSSLDKHSIRAIVPGEVFEPDASNEETREETERTLINILVYLQYIVPLHFGPKQRNDYRGMPQKEVNKIIGWPCLQGTHTRMAKNHGYIIKTMAGIKSLWDV